MSILDWLYINMKSAKTLETGAEYSWHFTVKATWERPRKINRCSTSVQCLLLYQMNKQTDMKVTLGSIYLNNEQLNDCHQEDKREQME